MKKKLDMLEELQEVDQMIDSLKVKQSGLHEELNDIAQAIDASREELATMQTGLAQLEQEKRDLEVNHAAELENILRAETNMKEIKTNKEFQAVGREITAARKQITDLEERVLQKIGQIEELSGTVAAKSAALEELSENSGRRIAEKQSEIENIQQDIDSDIARREILTKEMPASLVKRFAALRDQRRGQALAIARDGHCLGCNMHLPPQLYNNLFKYEELLTCPHCQRILILKQQ
ncbi:MAG: C4-type zinc ribbon domain-containing protein [Deltaproteobacteria bacterium]|nr:C4-type zinc ribbon domain-containing protein [Deltaproteobacteria bacterium]